MKRWAKRSPPSLFGTGKPVHGDVFDGLDSCLTQIYKNMYSGIMDYEEFKELVWIASSRKDMQALPRSVQRTFGYAIYAAQSGEKPPEAKPLKGFGGAGSLN